MQAIGSARTTGLFLLLAGTAFVIEGVVYLAQGSPDEAGTGQNVVALVAALALAVAVLGLPLPDSGGLRTAGRVGTGMALLGLVGQAFALLATFAGGGDVYRDTVFALGFVLMALGFVVYGVAVLRARMMSTWWGAAFVLPLLLAAVPGEFGVIVLGAVFAALGAWFLGASTAGTVPS